MKGRISLGLWTAGTVLAAIILTLVLGGVASLPLHRNDVDPFGAERVILQVAGEGGRWSDPTWQATIRAQARQFDLSLTVRDSNGLTIFQVSGSQPETASGAAHTDSNLAARSGSWSVADEHGRSLGTVTWYAPTEPLPSSKADDLALMMRIVIMLLLCAGAGIWIGYWLVRPLLALGRAAKNLAAGEPSAALPASPVKEVQALIDTFAFMVAELKQAGLKREAVEQERRILLGAVSHDLRTPLFSLRGHLEGIQNGLVNSPEKLNQYISHALLRVGNLERLVGDLMAYTKLNDLQQPIRPEVLNIGPYIESVTEGPALRAEGKGASIRLERPTEPCLVLADPDLLWRVFDNLLENAIRYTPAGGRIQVRWFPRDGSICVTVEDDGPGIPAPDIPHLFAPLFQGESSRTGYSGGAAGLGLAIAHRIVAAHQGSISAENLPEGGARFTVCLPKAMMST